MKTFNRFIQERLQLNKDTKTVQYMYHPKDFNELRSLLKQLLNERGKDADLNDIDVSQVTTFYDENSQTGLFEGLDPHNIDISNWDVSNVTNMRETFYVSYNFNCDLSEWDVSKVEDMYWMFTWCQEFAGKGLENWKVNKCMNFKGMFKGCTKLNVNLSNWKIKKEAKLFNMFKDCNPLLSRPKWYKNKE